MLGARRVLARLSFTFRDIVPTVATPTVQMRKLRLRKGVSGRALHPKVAGLPELTPRPGRGQRLAQRLRAQTVAGCPGLWPFPVDPCGPRAESGKQK